jgi:hypothetical protein
MPNIAREALRITKEATAGTFDAAATLKAVIPITSTGAFSGMPTPRPFVLRDAGASNRKVQTGFGTVGTDLRLRTPFWYSFSPVLLPLFCTPSGTPLELGTFTVDHYTMLEGPGVSTCVYNRFLGCMGESLTLAGDNTPQGTVMMADLQFPFMSYSEAITATDFPEPNLTDYPWPNSIAKFQHFGGNVSLGGTSRAGFKALSIGVKNIIAKVYDESAYPQALSWRGRDVDFAINLRHKTNADRQKFISLAANAVTVSFTDGTNTVAFDFKSQNFLTKADDERNMNDAHYQSLAYGCYVTAASTDMAVTITP